MSLINDMLKDLDVRERNHRRPLLPGLYAAASGVRYERRPWIDATTVIQAALTVLVASAVAWWFSHQPAMSTVRAVPVASVTTETLPVAAVTAVTLPAPVDIPVAVPAVPVPPAGEPEKPRVAVPAAAKAVASTRRAPPPVKAIAVVTTGKASAPLVPAPVKVDPVQKAEQLYQQALAEQKQGDAEAALKSLRESLEVYPQHSKARLALAQLLVDRKQTAVAAELLADGLMLLPQHTGFMLAIAPLWVQAGQQNDAMALLAQGTKSANSDPGYHAYYASQLLRLKRATEAVTHYRIALRSDANKSEWLLGLGLSLHAAGNVREAVDSLRRASESGGLSPQNKTMVDQVIVKLQTPAS
jgi:Tfp pilus assembly protein PilF